MQQETQTYQLEFNNGERFISKTKWLAGTQCKVVKHINANDLQWCKITCPNGAVTYVRKAPQWHPIHNGFTFSK